MLRKWDASRSWQRPTAFISRLLKQSEPYFAAPCQAWVDMHVTHTTLPLTCMLRTGLLAGACGIWPGSAGRLRVPPPNNLSLHPARGARMDSAGSLASRAHTASEIGGRMSEANKWGSCPPAPCTRSHQCPGRPTHSVYIRKV